MFFNKILGNIKNTCISNSSIYLNVYKHKRILKLNYEAFNTTEDGYLS